MNTRPPFVGPHEGRELEMMSAGLKPMSMFVAPSDSEFALFPEEEFDELVSHGKLVKRVSIEKNENSSGPEMRRTIYALPSEEWRVNALLLVLRLYDTVTPGWHPDLERVIGLLLGYERADIECFLNWMSERRKINHDGGV